MTRISNEAVYWGLHTPQQRDGLLELAYSFWVLRHAMPAFITSLCLGVMRPLFCKGEYAENWNLRHIHHISLEDFALWANSVEPWRQNLVFGQTKIIFQKFLSTRMNCHSWSFFPSAFSLIWLTALTVQVIADCFHFFYLLSFFAKIWPSLMDIWFMFPSN